MQITSFSFTLKVHITNEPKFSCVWILDAIYTHINDCCTFFHHICCDQLRNTYVKKPRIWWQTRTTLKLFLTCFLKSYSCVRGSTEIDNRSIIQETRKIFGMTVDCSFVGLTMDIKTELKHKCSNNHHIIFDNNQFELLTHLLLLINNGPKLPLDNN